MRRFWPWSGGTENTVAGYRLLRELGSGGFSTVQLAEELGAGRHVALKVGRDRSRRTQQRFEAEAAIGERLASARGVVGILRLTRTGDGRPVLVMPYYDLGSAADLLPADRRLPLPGLIALVRQVAQGLDAMHRQHYLHRDVSPRNILGSNELGIGLGDLGCARPINSTIQPAATEALTPGYAAPEATRGDAVQSIASDVYGLAATTWALLTGEPPHGTPPDPAALQLLARYELRRSSQPPPIEKLRAVGVPQAVADLLVAALDPDPSRRPARVVDLSEALTAAVSTGESPVQVAESRTASPTVGPIRPSRSQQADVDETQLVEHLARTRSPGEGQAVKRSPRPGRRRLLTIAGVAACFVVAFAVVRIVGGPGTPATGTSPGPSASPTPLSSPRPRAIAPGDLAMAKDAGQRLTLTWTPAKDTDVVDTLSVLYRSTGSGGWQRQDTVVDVSRGRVVVPVSSSRQRYCFRLVVLVGSSPGADSNDACTARGAAT